MMEARPDLDLVLVPLYGGGLAAGVALAVKTLKPATRVVGISMDRGAAMHLSLAAGHPVQVTEVPSLADSLGGGIGMQNELTFAMCRDLLDDTVLVTEQEIRNAMQVLFFEDRIVAEGASVVGLAASLAGKIPRANGAVGTIVTGRNLDMGMFHRIVGGEDVRMGDVLVRGRRYGA
jgi:threonine dehydratase